MLTLPVLPEHYSPSIQVANFVFPVLVSEGIWTQVVTLAEVSKLYSRPLLPLLPT